MCIRDSIKGFEALGAKVTLPKGGYIRVEAPEDGLHGAHIYFDVVTVGATMNIMLAAVLAKGQTIMAVSYTHLDVYKRQMYPSPGFLTEVTYLFAALDLTEGETHPDEDEFVETVRLPIAEVERLIAEDRLRDAKTIAAMYRARLKNLF